MKAISSADKANVISLLLSGHSIRKVESIRGLGKSTVGRMYQELEMDKDNYKGARSSKLSLTDQRRIVNQIITGKLDNAVQVTNYINTIIQKPVCSQIYTEKELSQGSNQGEKVIAWGQIQAEEIGVCPILPELDHWGLEESYMVRWD